MSSIDCDPESEAMTPPDLDDECELEREQRMELIRKCQFQTVVLSDRRPVRIHLANWDEIASQVALVSDTHIEYVRDTAKSRSYRVQVLRERSRPSTTMRRIIVCGMHPEGRRAGFLLNPEGESTWQDVIQCIRRVCGSIAGSLASELADRCIAELPPEEID